MDIVIPNLTSTIFLGSLTPVLEKHIVRFEDLLLSGDFNSEITETSMSDLKSLIVNPTCFKNPRNPSCIDLILTNKLL